MDKATKRKIKNYISIVCIVLLVILLAAMPLLAGAGADAGSPKASILSGTVANGDIRTVLSGGGTLAEEKSVEITLPSGVLLTEFLVSNGDRVSAGDPVASVDRVSLMNTITEVQDSLEYLAEELEAARNQTVSDKLTAPAASRVKLVYAQPGDDVRTVMLEHGALAVLSLDGMMAADITSDAALPAGTSVIVILSDGSEVSGWVASSLGGAVTVNIEDDGYGVGETVKIATVDGTVLGSSSLYINSPWKATAFSGTVKTVSVAAEDTVSVGKTLFTFSDTEYAAEFEALSAQHREYEEKMLVLFRLYQDPTLYAPCDGVIDGVDEESIHLLSNDADGWTLTFLSNAPNGDDTIAYQNFIGTVTASAFGSWVVQMDPTPQLITDYADLSGLVIDQSAMTEMTVYTPTAPIYERVADTWQQIDAASVAPGDVLLFAANDAAGFVWVVRVRRSTGTEEPPTQPEEPTIPSEPGAPTEPSDPTLPPVPSDPTTPSIPSYPDFQYPQIGSGGLSGLWGGYSQGGMVQSEPEFALYDLEESTILTVTPQDTMTLSITLDERDISAVFLGQQAQIKVDALRNVEFLGTVTKIASSGVNSGGSSKFTVELTLARSENMLSGMSATAELPLSTLSGVTAIPVAALVEDGAKTVVYTSYNADKEVLGDPVVVTTGVSDGETVQILSGLSVGDTYYYSYYDTLELSNIPNRNPFG